MSAKPRFKIRVLNISIHFRKYYGEEDFSLNPKNLDYLRLYMVIILSRGDRETGTWYSSLQHARVCKISGRTDEHSYSLELVTIIYLEVTRGGGAFNISHIYSILV